MNAQPLVDFAPAAQLALLAIAVALLPLGYVAWRHPRGSGQARLAALTAVTLFLTFDLVVFGAFTRLSNSGLGCPDWPGCYGAVSPLGARTEIDAAQAALPGGPVTWPKAWIEMIHRYLAMTVGVLILTLAAVAWRQRHRLPFSRWLPLATLAWVVVQGVFGKYTVTLKLYPAIVTLHLLGGLTLLALLAVQHAALLRRPVVLPRGVRSWAVASATLLAVQLALGGWVSTNYAVLACQGFPTCNGSWWPPMDAATGFTLRRGLGEGALSLDALVAIQMAHRMFAVVVVLALGVLAVRLWRAGGPAARGFASALALLLLAQLASGLSNVVLGWPLAAALGHSAGAAALVLVLTGLITRSAVLSQRPAGAASLQTVAA